MHFSFQTLQRTSPRRLYKELITQGAEELFMALIPVKILQLTTRIVFVHCRLTDQTVRLCYSAPDEGNDCCG